MNKYVKNTSDSLFINDIIKSKLPVLLDFWAEWCNPCKLIKPILEDLAKKYFNKINFFLLNVDENPKIIKKFNIKTIPTLIFFKKNKIQFFKTGFIQKNKLILYIEKNI